MTRGDRDATLLLDAPVLLATVDCSADGDRWTLSFVRHLADTPDAVWSTLTDPARLQRWAPYLPDRDLGTTGPVTMTVHGHAGSETLRAEVTCAERPVVLECTWPEERTRWVLHPSTCGTRVTLEHTFGERDWAAEAATAWHLHLDEAQRLLSCTYPAPAPGDPSDGSRRERLHDIYSRHLGFDPEPDRR